MRVDKKDKMIISIFARDPVASQESIAKEIGLSQPSVATRIKKLRECGAIETQTGINPFKMGLHMAKVDISTSDSTQLLEIFSNCPYFACGFSVSGTHNLTLFLMSENISSLERVINHHLRAHESVNNIEFNIITDSKKDFIVPKEVIIDVKKKPPCGGSDACKKCPSFKYDKCHGCPVLGNELDWFS
jgi:DNA-binding Lrp family transcriptional regulator